MRVRIRGGGWYGCWISLHLSRLGHDVELHEIAPQLFSGASGGNPARLHIGPHYPRSARTRRACQEHNAAFMRQLGFLTRVVPVNVYAIAQGASLVDFGTYVHTLADEIDLIRVYDPADFGLRNVEGAILCGERHIVIDAAREYFTRELGDRVRLNTSGMGDEDAYDVTIDCTFCSNDPQGIQRFEPCVTVLLEGPTDRATTIMDGPFGSVYPWREDAGLSSLTSAKYTPFSKECGSWLEAKRILDGVSTADVHARAGLMMDQMEFFWPAVRDLYTVAGHRLSIRAMPASAADERLVDVSWTSEKVMRVRAGKIDAIFDAARQVELLLERTRGWPVGTVREIA